MRLIGAALLTAAGLLLGLMGAESLRARVRRREALCRLLGEMAFELERFKTPLPALFASLARQSQGEAGLLCRRMALGLTQLGERTAAEIWAWAVSALPPVERTVLLPLGDVLGRYGAQEQLLALERVRTAMEREADGARRALEEKGRMYVSVAAAGAAALAVLLL